MKINIKEDVEFIEKKLKTYYVATISLIFTIILINVLLAIFTTYFNQTTFKIIAIACDVVFISIIYVAISYFGERYKLIVNTLKEIDYKDEQLINGKIVSIGEPLTYKRGIKTREICIDNGGRKLVFYSFYEIYDLDKYLSVGSNASLIVRGRFIMGVENHD